MRRLLARWWRDEAGFILSSELVLIATIVILAAVVGLSEVSLAINHELHDVAHAFYAVNQGPAGSDASSTSPEEISLMGVPPQPEAR